MKINAGNITAVIFAAVVIGGGMVNAYKNRDLLGAKLEGMTLDTAQKAFAAEGESFKQSFMGRNDLIDMYGVILNTLGKEVVGSFEFVKDKNGNMQSIGAAYDYSIFQESMTELRSAVSEDIPLMFVNLPEAAGREIMPVADYYDFQNSDREEICEALVQSGIEVMNVSDFAAAEDFYFKTDVHPKTASEFLTAREVYNSLREKGIDLRDGDTVFNMDNYTVVQRDFVGNLSRSSGRYFAGHDVFELYYPEFETAFELLVYEDNIYKSGTWKDVITNGLYEQDDIFNYYVTEYLQWPSPIYTIRNNGTESQANILYIADSMSLRTIAYLSLCAGEITVADTRYSQSLDYVMNLLANNSYDAVVVSAVSPHFINAAFESYIPLDELEGYTHKPLVQSTQWIARGGLWTDGQKSEKYLPVNEIDYYMDMYKISGWAVDFGENTVLTDLFASVNGKLYRCNYGYGKKGVVDRFGLEQLRYCGYSLFIPQSELSVGDKIEFIMVNRDTQTVYEPVVYEITE